MARGTETVRRFSWAGDIASVALEWAHEHGFEVGPSDDGVLRYRRVTGTSASPLGAYCVAVTASGQEVECRFWIVNGPAVRLAVLFLLPSSMGIESGGFRGFAARRQARAAANDLLARFGQPPIQ